MIQKWVRPIKKRRHSELLIACSGSELYRLSLDEGRFLSPYATALPEVNSIAVSDDHYLVSLGKIWAHSGWKI